MPERSILKPQKLEAGGKLAHHGAEHGLDLIRHDDDHVGRGGLRTEEDRYDRTEDKKKNKGSFHGNWVMGKSIEFLLTKGKKG